MLQQNLDSPQPKKYIDTIDPVTAEVTRIEASAPTITRTTRPEWMSQQTNAPYSADVIPAYSHKVAQCAVCAGKINVDDDVLVGIMGDMVHLDAGTCKPYFLKSMQAAIHEGVVNRANLTPPPYPVNYAQHIACKALTASTPDTELDDKRPAIVASNIIALIPQLSDLPAPTYQAHVTLDHPATVHLQIMADHPQSIASESDDIQNVELAEIIPLIPRGMTVAHIEEWIASRVELNDKYVGSVGINQDALDMIEATSILMECEPMDVLKDILHTVDIHDICVWHLSDPEVMAFFSAVSKRYNKVIAFAKNREELAANAPAVTIETLRTAVNKRLTIIIREHGLTAEPKYRRAINDHLIREYTQQTGVKFSDRVLIYDGTTAQVAPYLAWIEKFSAPISILMFDGPPIESSLAWKAQHAATSLGDNQCACRRITCKCAEKKAA